MKLEYILIAGLLIVLFNCSDDDIATQFETSYTITCQDEADNLKAIIGDEIFDEEDPSQGFRGNIVILNASGGCNNPITDLSLFEKHIFWRGSISIQSDDITDLSFLKNMEQIRDGLQIENCTNLTTIELPKLSIVQEYLGIQNNPNLTSISIGTDIDTEVYDCIALDSLFVANNEKLTSWEPGLQKLKFGSFASIIDNPSLVSLGALSELSMPSRRFNLDMYGVTINKDGINPDLDSLILPKETRIRAQAPGNDYSWLDKVKNRDRLEIVTDTVVTNPELVDSVFMFTMTSELTEITIDTVLVDSISFFTIDGEVEIDEMCIFDQIIQDIPLEINSNSVGPITALDLEDRCQ